MGFRVRVWGPDLGLWVYGRRDLGVIYGNLGLPKAN